MSITRTKLGAVVIAHAITVLSACTNSDAEGGSGGVEAVGAQTGAVAGEAKSAAEKDAGDSVQLEKRTVGFLQYTSEAEVALRQQAAAEAASKAVGWDFISCDGQGDPGKMGACGATLLDRGADVIIANSIPPSATRRALEIANERGIPWFIVGGAVDPSPLITASYIPDDRALGKELGEWYVDAAGGEDAPTIVVNEFCGIAALCERETAFKDALKPAGNISIVGEEEIDYANVVQDVTRDVTEQVDKNPDVRGIISITNHVPPIVQALKQRGYTSDDGPLVAGFFADKINLDAIRAGTADAVAEWPLEADNWSAIDMAAQFVARDQKPHTTLDGAYSLNFAAPSVITKDNLPPKGEYPAPAADFVTYFTTKWGLEFKSE